MPCGRCPHLEAVCFTDYNASLLYAAAKGPWSLDPKTYELTSKSPLFLRWRTGWLTTFTVTLPGPKGVPIPGWFEWDKYLNKVYVVKEWKDQDQNQTPVVRTFFAFQFSLMQVFSLCLTWTETVLGQMRLLIIPRTFCGLCNRDGHFPFFCFVLTTHLPFFARAATSQVVASLGPFGLASNRTKRPICWTLSCLPTSAFFLNTFFFTIVRAVMCVDVKSRDVVV